MMTTEGHGLLGIRSQSAGSDAEALKLPLSILAALMDIVQLQAGRLWLIRCAGVLLMAVLLYQSWRTAWADSLSESRRPGDIEKAIALEPDNAKFWLRKASREMFAEDAVARDVEAELRTVLKQNPWSSEALMDLGVLAEGQGNAAEAEQFLLRAATLDHTFKPAWTLANFYYRTNQTEKMWPQIRAALDVITKPQLEYFSTTLVYDLCWQTGVDSKQLLALVPDRPVALLGYFTYLVFHKHLDATKEVYPRVISVVDASVRMYRDRFADYCNQLFEAGDLDKAVAVWNQLVGQHLVFSTAIEPERGITIANAAFAYPFEPLPFGWYSPPQQGVTVTFASGMMVFDLSGEQQDMTALLEKNLALIPGRQYLLTWKADGSQIKKPVKLKESGLTILFYDHKQNQLPVTCPTLLDSESARRCVFRTPDGLGKAIPIKMKLLALRQLGSVRLRGTFQISSFSLAAIDPS